MNNSDEFKNRMIGGFIVICISMIAISGAFLALNYMGVTLVGAVLFGFALFLLLFLLHSQRINKREISELKYYLNKPSDLEDGLIRRIEDLARKIDTNDISSVANSLELASKQSDETKVSILQLQEELRALANQVEIMAEHENTTKAQSGISDSVVSSIEAQENKIVPLPRSRPSTILSSDTVHNPDSQDRNNVTDHGFSGAQAGRASILADIGAADLTQHARNKTLIERVCNAVNNNELELHLQPIVNLNDREPEFYESTLRFKEPDGTFVEQRKLNRFASEGQVAVALDSQILFSAVRVLRTLNELQKKTGLFCPLSASTLEDGDAFDDAFKFLKANLALANSLILEIEQVALESLGSRGRDRLSQLADLGFPLALDNVQRFELEGSLLHAAGFRHLKVSVQELLKITDDANIDELVTEFSDEMESCGLTIIVSDIEQETQVIHLIDFDLPLGQGSLFSPSRPVKPELLKATDENDAVSGFIIA